MDSSPQAERPAYEEPGDDSDPTGVPARVIAGIAAALAAVFLLVGGLLWNAVPPAPPDVGAGGHVLPVPRSLSDFSLVDQEGRAFGPSELEGHWSLLFFGYTYCPDICPNTLGQLARVESELGEHSMGDDPAPPSVVFVSVDPKRDTPQRLKEYVRFFDPGFIGVTGDTEEIDRLTKSIGVFHQTREPAAGDASGYLVDHSTSLFLVDPQAELRAVLHEPRDPAEFAETLRKIQAAGGGRS